MSAALAILIASASLIIVPSVVMMARDLFEDMAAARRAAKRLRDAERVAAGRKGGAR